jgi:hypothetical protein
MVPRMIRVTTNRKFDAFSEGMGVQSSHSIIKGVVCKVRATVLEA